MKTKLNFNVPDDLHGGLLTPGVMNEGVMTMNQACFEYIASDLIRRVNLDDIALRYFCYNEQMDEPTAYWNPETFDQEFFQADEEDSEEREELQELHDFLQEHKESIASYKESLMKELQDLLVKIWESFSQDTHCSTSAVSDNFHVIYCTEDQEDDATHTFEIFCIEPDMFDQYYHSSWMWFDKGSGMIN